MSPREPRVQPCSKAEGRTRLRHAMRFLEVAELVAESPKRETISTTPAPRLRSRCSPASPLQMPLVALRSAAGHVGRITVKRQALVGKVEPGGKKAATSLRRLLSLKDEAHYGFFDVGGQQLSSALRQASALVEFAQDILRR